MNRTMNRLFLRLVMLCIAVILGAIAVSQAQKGLAAKSSPTTGVVTAGVNGEATPIQAPDSPGFFNRAASAAQGAAQKLAQNVVPVTNGQNTTSDSGFSQPGEYGASAYDSRTQAQAPTDQYAAAPTGSTGYPEYGQTEYGQTPPAASAYDTGNSGDSGYAASEPANYESAYDSQPPAADYGAPAPAQGYGADAYAAAPADEYSDQGSYESNAYQADLPPAQVATVGNDVLDAAPPTAAANPIDAAPPLPPAPDVNTNDTMVLPSIDDLPTPLAGQVEPADDGFPVPPAADNGYDPAYGDNNNYDGGYDTNKPQSGGYDSNEFAPQPSFDSANESQELQPTPPALDEYSGRGVVNMAQEQPTAAPSPFGPGNGGTTLQPTAPAANPFSSSAAGSPGSTMPASIGSGPVGNGKPGPTQLEGPQTPTLTVSKSAPPEIQVGKPAQFTVVVRNIGSVDAHDVLIRDEVPHGAQLVDTNPPANRTQDGAILWQMGTVKAGAEVTATMNVMPTVEGDIGSVATVSFQTSASARSLATKPQLVLEHTGPGKVLVGDDVIFHIKLSNPGTGVAHNVVVEEDVPAGLRHLDGPKLEYPVGTIRPGETRLLELTLKADQPGMVDNALVAKADANLAVKDNCQVEIVAPMLQVGIVGPTRRYLERRANFEVKVANPGTAPAKDVELVARLPRGLKFVSTNNAGQYNSQEHAVYWSLTELGADKMGTVQLVAVPTDMGDQRIRVESRANMGLTDATEHNLTVEGLAAMLFTVTDVNDPIEVSGQTTYEIHILNQGSKVGSNLTVAAELPPGMEPINGEGPTRFKMDGNIVMFEPLPRLAPQADTLYKIHARGTTPGDKRIRVQLNSDDVAQPVTKEESTHVYSDQ